MMFSMSISGNESRGFGIVWNLDFNFPPTAGFFGFMMVHVGSYRINLKFMGQNKQCFRWMSISGNVCGFGFVWNLDPLCRFDNENKAIKNRWRNAWPQHLQVFHGHFLGQPHVPTRPRAYSTAGHPATWKVVHSTVGSKELKVKLKISGKPDMSSFSHQSQPLNKNGSLTGTVLSGVLEMRVDAAKK